MENDLDLRHAYVLAKMAAERNHPPAIKALNDYMTPVRVLGLIDLVQGLVAEGRVALDSAACAEIKARLLSGMDKQRIADLEVGKEVRP